MAADTTESLPRYLAPLPQKIETGALRYAWVIVAINLAGTAFGFWYYIPQFRLEPVLAWPVVPDSPVATLFIACSLALYKPGRSNEYLNMLAFFGCIKLGLWTPYVLTVFADAFLATVTPPPQVVPLLGRELASNAMTPSCSSRTWAWSFKRSSSIGTVTFPAERFSLAWSGMGSTTSSTISSRLSEHPTTPCCQSNRW